MEMRKARNISAAFALFFSILGFIVPVLGIVVLLTLYTYTGWYYTYFPYIYLIVLAPAVLFFFAIMLALRGYTRAGKCDGAGKGITTSAVILAFFGLTLCALMFTLDTNFDVFSPYAAPQEGWA